MIGVVRTQKSPLSGGLFLGGCGLVAVRIRHAAYGPCDASRVPDKWRGLEGLGGLNQWRGPEYLLLKDRAVVLLLLLQCHLSLVDLHKQCGLLRG
jgi:hypothetical protein